ncbi:putative phosphatidylserine decarboxylase [Medicago truncatula]|uniref:Phosphatidylserine decarboxylase proenzyme 1, mitochondrial n=1 Tax=Medicago truncatula TaxID=3880 RepID=G7JXD5_MEDTR|nr:phosphatidylserine decarboxylase proenzyme 1, mitochondrial [Medicago truncatula]AES94292.2 phosphatidylserine decarboxylase [Medicago truncatula]RHN53766.1 putative phosphatidylserine decarboxylase [Medicago truncatula]
MKPRVPHRFPILSYHTRFHNHTHKSFTSFIKNFPKPQPPSSVNGANGNSKGDSSYLLPGATVATILMLGALHARRMYDDKKIEKRQEKGIEVEFQPDVKASFMSFLPLRSISRCWGQLTSMEIPAWLRPHVYKAWARAFHSNLEEAALPLDKYTSLREFFVRALKEGSRPIDTDPQCLVSPVDGKILRFGELKGAGAMIEQVKGFSYPVFSLLGASSLLPTTAHGNVQEETSESIKPTEKSKKSWWRVSLASPKVWDPTSSCPKKGLFYCVIYLKPGDYNRIHSPADWNILVRRHFSGHLYPVNERATRTIRNLYIENERVVLEGVWQEGFMALAAVGATNIGSIELFIEPELQTNKPIKKSLNSEPPEERVYDCEGVGKVLKKGDELGAFNMGSTVVLVFQAPISKLLHEGDSSQEFNFNVKCGDRIKVGEALGRWHSS